jgi:transcriptional regulator with XRE-family HTH domain
MKVYRQLLCDRSLNFSKMAKEIGRDRGTVDGWASGRSSPSVDSLEALARFFGVPASYLIENVSYVTSDPAEAVR